MVYLDQDVIQHQHLNLERDHLMESLRHQLWRFQKRTESLQVQQPL